MTDFENHARVQTAILEVLWLCRETRRKTGAKNINLMYREKPVYSTQFFSGENGEVEVRCPFSREVIHNGKVALPLRTERITTSFSPLGKEENVFLAIQPNDVIVLPQG